MRVPYPVVLILTLLLTAGVWWFRTREMDFMSPRNITKPLPSFIGAAEDHSGSPGLPDPVSRPATSDGPTPPAPEPEADPLRLGDLDTSPGLGEYSELASLGAEHLSEAAAELEVRGEFQRALLAWERVLDTCEPTDPERKLASDSIQRIRPTLPRWNIDPDGEVPLLLQFGTTRDTSETLSQTAEELAEFLRKQSSDLIAVVPRITTSRVRGAPKQAPIALYFTGPDKEDEDTQSDVVSVNPPLDDPEVMKREMLVSLYGLIVSRLAGLETLTPPPPLAAGEDAATAYERNITRLHWQYFARSLWHPPTEAPPLPPPGPEEPDHPVN